MTEQPVGSEAIIEDPPEDVDQEFAIIRSMLPEELFAGKESK